MKKIISAALLTLAVGGANAQAYLGASIGVTNANLPCAGTTKCDKTDDGAKLYGGYTMTEGLAVEAGYLDLGKYLASTGATNRDYTAHAGYLALAARGEFTDEFGGTLRLGVARVTTDRKAGTSSANVTSTSDSKSKFYFGAGLDYAITKHVKIVAAADFTTAEVLDEQVTVRMLSLGAQYNF